MNRGEVVALMGRNGAGKSTTMKAVMGLIARRSGRVVWRGQDISALPGYRIARLGLGWVPEGRFSCDNASGCAAVAWRLHKKND